MHSILFLLSLHSSKNKTRYYFLAWGWRMGTFYLYPVVYFSDLPIWGWGIGTFCLYPDIHSEVICSCDWRIGTLYLYPDPLQCLVQLGLEDRYILLVPRSTPIVFCSGGWRIGTLCLYLSVHFNVTSCCVWRSGTFCLYPAPLQCLMQRGLEGRYSLSVPTNSLFTVTCRCGWRIGTLCLYPDPLHCIMQQGL